MIIPYSKVIDFNIRYERPENSQEGLKHVTFLSVLMTVCFALLIIFPWFLGYPFLKTIAGILWLLVAWVFGAINLAFLFNKDEKLKIRTRTLGITIFMFLLGCFMAYHILRLDEALNHLLAWLTGFGSR
ncbi:hypothetical protein [Dyadobacter psychrotolerans]|uniref:Uncharacterized protein n=1 Tax=Dyadobacter psychrotolerans TaxID=2541721 RepID=A0A4R5DQG7_9BACT|nr:hypothetical protein [Dyadobacter psychrotolerans]TDE14420.1 hypothetical protein E0F88_14560 [Dyadobacter psychrotolerans]